MSDGDLHAMIDFPDALVGDGWEVKAMRTNEDGVAIVLARVGAMGTRRRRVMVFDDHGRLLSMTEMS